MLAGSLELDAGRRLDNGRHLKVAGRLGEDANPCTVLLTVGPLAYSHEGCFKQNFEVCFVERRPLFEVL